ncbi:hypothetical protein CBM2599_B30160 [Cupriavidus taiwanensis]|nr:hypothetical protein CBM2599_B30160 [Cupriavidus taiwanensis]SOY98909.1 hypothetical protein CBM2600_B30416 [Cupriavidus taiwanensis]
MQRPDSYRPDAYSACLIHRVASLRNVVRFGAPFPVISFPDRVAEAGGHQSVGQPHQQQLIKFTCSLNRPAPRPRVPTPPKKNCESSDRHPH